MTLARRSQWEAQVLGEMDDTAQQDATLCVELSTKQVQVIAALASGASVSQAARLAQVHRATIYRWRTEDAEFVERLERVRAEQLWNMRSELRSLAVHAIRTLRRLMTDDMVDENVRFKAALAVLQALKCPGVEAI